MALAEWLAARARGRTAEQLRSAVDSPKAVEGTAAAAAALGFVDEERGTLTPLGERFALADAAERQTLLAGAVRDFAPYEAVLHALAARGGQSETEVRWIEAFWATRSFGSSESNRREGAAAFGRLADFAGLGEYVPGRRGRPTRIRWAPGVLSAATPAAPPRAVPATAAGARTPHPAPDLFTLPPPAEIPAARPHDSAPARAEGGARGGEAGPGGGERGGGRRDAWRGGSGALRQRSEATVNRITIPLAGTTVARVEVPLRLPAAEKRRLLDLLELLIAEE